MTLKVPCSFHSLVTPASHFFFFPMLKILVAVLRIQEPHLGTKARLLTILTKKKLGGKPEAPTQVQGSEAQYCTEASFYS